MPFHLDTLFIYGILGAASVVAALSLKRRFPLIEGMVWAVFACLVMFAWMMSPNYEEMYQRIGLNLILGAVGFFLYREIEDFQTFHIWLKRMSFMMTVSLIVLLYTSSGLDTTQSEYSMYYGYLIFPAFVISVNEMISTKSIPHTVNSIVSLLLTLAMGARGPMVCEIAFVVIILILHKTKARKKVAELAITVAATFVIYKYFYIILAKLNVWFVNLGLSTRTIVKIQRGVFFQSAGRDSIKDITYDLLNQHFLSGVGPGRDRMLIASRLSVPSENAFGCYPHNFFREVLLQFGIIFGVVIIIAIVCIILLPFFVKKMDEHVFSVYMICFAVGFFPLMISGSYLTSHEFFQMLGLDVAILASSSIAPKNYFHPERHALMEKRHV